MNISSFVSTCDLYRGVTASATRLLIALFLCLQGCTALQAVREETIVSIDQFPAFMDSDDPAISPHAIDSDIPDTDILALNQTMKAILDESILPIQNPLHRLDHLVGIMITRVKYDPADDAYGAKTAIETFETQTGNTLSFSNLFVSMTRYAGFSSSFREIPATPTWINHGENLMDARDVGVSVKVIITFNRMLQAGFIINDQTGDGKILKNFVFIPSTLDDDIADINPFTTLPISDERAFAQYYNNIGVKFLSEGNHRNAFRYFIKAVKTDPGLGFAWSNLGVVYSRNSQPDAAEKAFLQALKINRGMDDTSDITVMGNMERLYRKLGNNPKEMFYKHALAALKDKNPYYHFSLGQEEYQKGNFEESIRQFENAIRIKADEHQFYYAMAIVYLRVGDLEKAEADIEHARMSAWNPIIKLYYRLLLNNLTSLTHGCGEDCVRL